MIGHNLKSGIYQIRNLINGKIYIGSTVNFGKRWTWHKIDFKWKRNSCHLQSAWDKYGKQNFVFEIIEYVCENFLAEAEQFWIEDKKSWDKRYGYNIERIINGHKIISEETKKKISESLKGEKNPFYGKKHTEETKEKISQNHHDVSGKNNPMWGKIRESGFHSKLTPEEVLDIRRKFKNGYSYSDLYEEYKHKITKCLIGKIINRESWKHLPEEEYNETNEV